MKTAISIPDELYERGEALARRLGKSRSQIYRDALAEYVSRRDASAVTAALDALVDKSPPKQDPWLGEAGRQVLERSEW